MFRIADIRTREIVDSRSESTVEITLIGGRGESARAQIPAGKSTGTREVIALDPRSVERVVSQKLRAALRGKSFPNVRAVERVLSRIDHTPNKRIIGGNTMLGVSVASVRLAAQVSKREPWEVIRSEYFPGEKKATNPLIFANLINGGAHAQNGLDPQEYMVVVHPRGSMQQAVANLVRFYHALGKDLAIRAKGVVPIGDEGGYATHFKNNAEPLEILRALIHRLKVGPSFALALDVAASNFLTSKGYRFGGKMLTREALFRVYEKYLERYPIFSIEDPFGEDDSAGFHMLMKHHKRMIVVGDDLTTTDAAAIERAAEADAIRGVIIKPNQIGSVGAACEAIHMAKRHGVFTIVSHRSGETEDPFIIHLARAANADGVKIGAPARERVVKYNELTRLYGE